MSIILYSLSKWVTRNKVLVCIFSIILLLSSILVWHQFAKPTDQSISIPNTKAQVAMDKLKNTFPQMNNSSAYLVIESTGDPVPLPKKIKEERESFETVESDVTSAKDTNTTSDGSHFSVYPQSNDLTTDIENIIDDIKNIKGVYNVSSPYGSTSLDYNKDLLSKDEQSAIINISLDHSWSEVSEETKKQLENSQKKLQSVLGEYYSVFLGGELYSTPMPTLSAREFVGVGIALLILLLVLGSAITALLPIITAGFAVAIAMLNVLSSSVFMQILSFTPMLGLMLGTAVSIDYAFFIISKHLYYLKQGETIDNSIARSIATSGNAVVFAGITVMLGLVGLLLTGLPFLGIVGITASFAIVLAVIICLFLLPALLSILGDKVLNKKARKKREKALWEKIGVYTLEELDLTDSAKSNKFSLKAFFSRFFEIWAKLSMKFSGIVILFVIILCSALAIPSMKLSLIIPDAKQQSPSSEARKCYEAVERHFGEGYNGPLVLTGSIIHSDDPINQLKKLSDYLLTQKDVSNILLATPNESIDTAVIVIIPSSAPNSKQTIDLVNRLRDQKDLFAKDYSFEDSGVTGKTAVSIDISEKLTNALLPFCIFVVGLCLLLLIIVFRSIFIPLTAAIGFLLSLAAGMGVVSFIYTYKIGADFLGIVPGGIMCFVPIITTGILFGLSMDYEMFLLSSISEEYSKTHDPDTAIKNGFMHSGKIIVAVSLIMSAVFASFIFSDSIYLKPIAIALTVGVLVDALFVRMTLMPALLHLFRKVAWKIPKWLDKALPNVDIEGCAMNTMICLKDWGNNEKLAVIAQDIVLDGIDSTIKDLKIKKNQISFIQSKSNDEIMLLTACIAGVNNNISGKIKVLGKVVPLQSYKIRKQCAFLDLSSSDWDIAIKDLSKEKFSLLVINDLSYINENEKDLLLDFIKKLRSKRNFTTIIGNTIVTKKRQLSPVPIIFEYKSVKSHSLRVLTDDQLSETIVLQEEINEDTKITHIENGEHENYRPDNQ